MRALNTLVDANRRILIDGWYEGLWELGEEELEQLEANASRLDLNKLKQEWGIEKFAGRDGVEAIKARAYEPTCNIAGLTSGYQGPGSKTIVPNEARAKLDMRLPPLIDPAKAIDKLKRHLVEHGFGHIEVIIRGARPSRPTRSASRKTSARRSSGPRPPSLASRRSSTASAPKARSSSTSGCLPCSPALPSPTATCTPDESIDLEHYIKGIKYAAAIMWEYGQMEHKG